MRISIIVPVYNVADHLPRCLDSILAQTYADIEIVAVNDGSSDISGEILDRYAANHTNVRVIHKENGGVTSARLRGVAEATGEWIGFVDGDDEIEPDMYKRLLHNAIKYDAQISHCGYQMQFADGRVHYFYNSGTCLEQDRISALRELLSGERIDPGLCNKLFHETLLQGLIQNEVVDTSIRITEDMLMNYYLFAVADKVVYEDWCPYHYIVRSGSATRTKMNKYIIYDPIRVKEIICRDAVKEIQDDAKRAYINTCISTYHSLLCAGAEYREDLRKVRDLLKQEKEGFLLLGKKRALMAWMISCMPVLYKPIYSVYCRYFQKQKYS